jgi:deaminated glutathione amidase
MADTPRPFVAALIQMRSTRDPLANRDAAVALAREAAAAGAAYVQTPEMTSLVERSKTSLFEKIGPEESDPTIAAMREVARDRKITVHIGSVALKAGDKVANRAIVIAPDGDVVATYDKIHLFDVDLPSGVSWRESSTYTGGEDAVVAQTPLGPLGVTICYDLRFPYLYRALAEWGVGILTAPSCFTKETGEAHWHVLQRARAIENGAFMLSAAQGGKHEDGRDTYGHSIIVDPWGRVLAEGGIEPGLVMAEIDPALIADARQRIPSLKHTRPMRVTLATSSREIPPERKRA